MQTPHALRGLVGAQARAQGFAAVGVARAEPVADADRLMQWLAAGRHGTMGWLAERTEWRLDPRAYFPECRSVVVVAEPYWTSPAKNGPCGRVSNYAWGTADYHGHMLPRLRALGGALDAAAGSRTKAVVDTAPVLEKFWAAQAGIGWLGKHTNILSRELGSWFFLGVLLTTADIAPDGPVEDHCGTCTACLDACPTDAFPAPYQLDARRCISYLTIEHRGAIDESLRGDMGEFLFGCDACQDVCPWNDRAFEPAGVPYARSETWTHRAPAEAFAWSEDQFRAATRGTPVSRAKRAGLARNLAIVLGNRGRDEDAAALAIALGHDDPMVREAAAWALGRIGGAGARAALEVQGQAEGEPAVLDAIASAMEAV